jgi:putative nucleotidyltransferase with HDIG domain
MAETDPNMDRLRGGDKEAWKEANKILFPLATSVVQEHLPNGTNAHDVALETLIEIMNPGCLDGVDTFDDLKKLTREIAERMTMEWWRGQGKEAWKEAFPVLYRSACRGARRHLSQSTAREDVAMKALDEIANPGILDDVNTFGDLKSLTRKVAECAAIVKKLEKLPPLNRLSVTMADFLCDLRRQPADDWTGVRRRSYDRRLVVLRAITLAYCKSTVGMPRAKSLDWPMFWKHSIGVGFTASMLAEILGLDGEPDSFFTCGLLHDVGKVVSSISDVRLMNLALRVARESGCELIEAERGVGAPPHDILGAALCELWGLPSLISDVVANHHEDGPFRRNLADAGNEVFVDVVTLANFLVHRLGFGDSGHNAKTEPSGRLLSRLGLSAADLPSVLLKVDGELHNCLTHDLDGRN